jgi:endonuclease/exonuclease/phosphatase (EEP) superfamily protein YafD
VRQGDGPVCCFIFLPFIPYSPEAASQVFIMEVNIGELIVYILGYFIIVVSLIPLIRNDNWMFRVFEYPRGQKLVLNIVLLALFLFLAKWEGKHPFIFAGLLTANALYLFYQVFPYTFVARKQLKGRRKDVEEGKQLKLIVCNVYQENRMAAKCIDCILKHKPEIILFVETDHWWKGQLASLEEHYRFNVSIPLENTYGMLLYSKLELVEPQIKYLIEEGIPSVHTKVKLPSGDLFYLYCLHPQPPVPQENPRSTERDAEILTIAKEAKKCHLPVVVAGDLNDVAWSYTTELFLKISALLDPRRGRGFFNTFHAKYWFLRWPLDHIFCSKHFQLVNLRRLPFIGSDHFPILVELGLIPADKPKNEGAELEASAEEAEVAEEKIDKA